MTLLERYNQAYNNECIGLACGGPISMEHLQAMTLESLLMATQATNVVSVDDIRNLIEALYQQGKHNG